MTDAEIRDYLDGFIAWDTGCRSSGIKDDGKRAQVKQHLLVLSGNSIKFRELVHPFVFTHPAFEDIQAHLDWLREFLDFDDWSGL